MALPVFTPPYPPTTNENQPEVKILKAEFGDGYTQEGGDGMNNVRSVLRLKWTVLTAVQAQTMETFFRNLGGYKRFLYKMSDSTTLVRYSCNEWSRERGTPNTFTATFRQQFDLGDQ